MILSAFVSFFAFWFILRALPTWVLQRLVGYVGLTDTVMHVTVLWLFIGTSTHGLLQAEAAAICFSLYLRWYRWAWGYQRRVNGRWWRYYGHLRST